MNHKIVCWGDYAIPVPEKYKWLAMDKSGEWLAYLVKPKSDHLLEMWMNFKGAHMLTEVNIDPPEPGPWTEQLYWIG